MRKILEANTNLADRMISIINKCDRSLSAHRMKTVQPALMNGSVNVVAETSEVKSSINPNTELSNSVVESSEVKSSVLLNDPVLSASACGPSTRPDLGTLVKDKLATEVLFPVPPQQLLASYDSEEECPQEDDRAYNPSNPGMQSDPLSNIDNDEIPEEKK